VAAILAQSVQPQEIIIIDDASTDGSHAVVRELAPLHPTLRVLENDRNRGVGYTSNRGLALSRAEYVTVLAADDLVLPGFFATALRMAEAYPTAGMIYGKMAMISEVGDPLIVFEVSAWQQARYATPQQFLQEHLESEDPSHSLCGATIYRREALLALGGYRTELGHWMDTFVARAIGLRHGVCYVPEPFMQWRYSEQGFCARSRWEELVRIVKRAAGLMRSHPYCQWFPERHVAWWEQASLDNLFHARVRGQWPLLERWSQTRGIRARFAHHALRVLACLNQWAWALRPAADPPSAQS
jgi:glycosyltransferase involved in cell wall biosynthesis